MTNNPTIDGVSRSAIEQALLAMKRIYQAGYDRILEAGGQCDTPEYMMAGDPTARELRALLDAPAVERQEPSANLADGIQSLERISASIDARQQRIDALNSDPELAALQSTIAQLQARIGDLESWRGEPVAWANGEQLKLCAASPREVQPNNPMMHNLPRNIAGSALKTDYCNTPLFTAPPAPVAVVLPERAQPKSWNKADIASCDMSYIDGWNACLDATAALNGERK